MRLPKCTWCGQTAEQYLAFTPTTGNASAQLSYQRHAFCCPDHLREWANTTSWGDHPDPVVADEVQA
jgi:hypothetical protein